MEYRERLLLDNGGPEPDDDARLEEQIARTFSVTTATVHDSGEEAHAGVGVMAVLVLVFLLRLQTASVALLILLQCMLLSLGWSVLGAVTQG